jgi:N-acyl-D-amino-acid deacylase
MYIYRSTILILLLFFASCSGQESKHYDLIIKNGTVIDGTGAPRMKTAVAVSGDTIAAVGDLRAATADTIIDARGLIVAPGFINMLSWANYSLLNDGRSMSNIKQGVTLEIFGEGSSMGPVRPELAKKEDMNWQTLGEYLEYLTDKGVSPNVASFVGATTIRVYELGTANRAPTPEELDRMQDLVRQAMREGALGVGTSLIYAPAFFANTDELIALAEAAAEYDGMYISHLRSEGDHFLQAVDEFFTIATEANIDAEIYHLKAAGRDNWHKLDVVLSRIDSLRSLGHNITTNMYTYPAASTGLDATVPPWVQEGTTEDFHERLQDPNIRRRVLDEMNSSNTEWENFLQLAGSAENILLLEFKNESLQKYTGKTLAEVAEDRNAPPAETILDLLQENGGDIPSVFFVMSEENIRKKIQAPYMSFGSDARSVAAEGSVIESSTHPRTYGTFARLLGKYVREDSVLTLEEAVYRLTGLPAANLKLKRRGRLAEGYKADIVLFDAARIIDKATYRQPHQYAEGMVHVFVNGVQVLKHGQHTGALPGQVVRGPGYKKGYEQISMSN